MILRTYSLGNAWYRCAVIFLTALPFSLGIIFISLDEFGYDGGPVIYLIKISVVAAVLQILIGRLFGQPRRLMYFVMVVGIFGCLPTIFLTFSPIICLLLICPLAYGVIFSIGYLAFVVFYSYMGLRLAKNVEKKRKYLECQITETGYKIFSFDADNAKNFSNLMNNGERISSEFLNKSLPIILSTSLLSYPLYKVLSNTAGPLAVLGFMTLLSTPLSIHAIRRMSIGCLLWIVLVRKYEKNKGGKVYLATFEELNQKSRG